MAASKFLRQAALLACCVLTVLGLSLVVITVIHTWIEVFQ